MIAESDDSCYRAMSHRRRHERGDDSSDQMSKRQPQGNEWCNEYVSAGSVLGDVCRR